MAEVKSRVLLVLFLFIAVADILPARGNHSDDVIAQLQLQIQSMKQRLESLEEQVKIIKVASHDGPTVSTPEEQAVWWDGLGTPDVDDNQDPIDERVMHLENVTKILTEGASSATSIIFNTLV